MRIDKIHKQFTQSIREGADLRLQLINTWEDSVFQAAAAICRCLRSCHKVFLFGNGGSVANAQHIAAEFVGRFTRDRIPLPAIALTTGTSAPTAIGNHYGFKHVFARQVRALAVTGDVAIAISTSGRSINVIAGAVTARKCGLTTIGLTGAGTGQLANSVNIPIVVPSMNTSRIQECHITIGHLLCEIVQSVLFDDLSNERLAP